MDKAEMFGINLEVDHRTEAQRQRQGAKDGVFSALGLGKDSRKAMDSDYLDNIETERKVRIDASFSNRIQGIEESNGTGASMLFDIETLFEAVASGDVTKLEGLYEHLENNDQKLSDTLYVSRGKTALMKALLHLRDGRNETVECLLNTSEMRGDLKELVNKEYTDYYEGQTALHIAIERRSIYYVELLVSKGADVHIRACGKFFRPHDGPYFYFGELPLSLAACTNQPDMVDFLMDNRYLPADAGQVDSLGNTVLHALVVVADKDNTKFITSMYDHILTTNARLHPKIKLEGIKNREGLTPLKMAAKTGKIGIFSHILQREFHESHTKHLSRKFTEWVYGPAHCSLYDLDSVDSCEDASVVEILVYSSDIPNRHEMLETEPLKRLLEEKWKKFAGPMFLLNFVVYFLYLIVFTIVAYNKQDGKPQLSFNLTTTGYLYVTGLLLTLVANIYFFFMGIIDMVRKRPKLKALLIDGYYEILFFVQGALFLISAGLYVIGREEYLGFLVVCLALSWVNLLYYSRGHRHMGIYSVMIQKMILGDILRFLFVYVVFLFGFSAAVVTLLIEPPVKNETKTRGKGRLFGPLDPDEECLKPSFRNISYTTLQLFKFTIGMGDMEFTQGYQYREVFYVLLIGYIILTYILLLNMLIALMNQTVEKINKESASIWRLQRAITILDMEKRLPYCLRKRLRCGVETKLGTALGNKRRWCFRVEEVNWNKWNNNLSKINEDPGRRDYADSPVQCTKDRGRSWRGWFVEGSRRRRTDESTEMIPLSTTPV